ncbi:MAG: endonuclease/exonuclease/phosphatase family protein [Gemmatimonadaceae bacterium]|jgi:endonuclease/exonuclease/phosphatase family metal-dependent hydrolase|nr:endonuclease/exonuclease/phosphatase family protein [Gemmatimonadaceae bacterium]
MSVAPLRQLYRHLYQHLYRHLYRQTSLRHTALCALLLWPLTSGCTVSARATRRASTPSEPAAPASIALMSFNLRYDNPADGPNAWPRRRDHVAGAIRFHGAQVVGVQEALASMLRELDALLPTYRRVGVGRSDGAERGEFSAILYDTTRVTALESGTFWLSPTPDVVGSKGWDAALERIATWARFRDKQSGCTWVHVNTHFDHVGDSARVESARLIRRRLGALAKGLPLTMTGDFNANPSHPAYVTLTTSTLPDGSRPLRDALHVSDTPHYGPFSTWNAFKDIEPDRRIDFVFVSDGVRVRRHGILSDRWDGRFLSDHLPVLAEVQPCSR